MLATETLEPSSAEEVAKEVARRRGQRQPPSFLIAAAPGMGKTSFLEACVRALPDTISAVSVSGGAIASEGHFVHVLHASSRGISTERRDWKSGLRAILTEPARTSMVLAIDDFDQLVYKREELARALAAAATDVRGPSLLVSSARSTVERILGAGRPFQGLLRTIQIGPLDDIEADHLIQRRARALPSSVRAFIVSEAAGHPGAIVYLSRVTELLMSDGGNPDDKRATRYATEFAGSVYAESWSTLGPQQRAILTHLSRLNLETSSVTQIASGVLLQPSHVSAQLRRLMDEGLVRRDSRGSYAIAPLLARWIVARRVWQQLPGE